MKTHWLQIVLPLAILAISMWQVNFTQVWLYPAALLLPLLFFLARTQIISWRKVLIAALLGGFLCWKATDLWPLLPGSNLLCAALLMISVILLCRSREERLLACAAGGLIFESFFCLREYMLFSFCVIRLGSQEGLSLSTAAACLYSGLEQVRIAVHLKKKRNLSM